MRPAARACIPLVLLSTVAAGPHVGGGTLISMDEVPDYFVVGQPVTLSFTARQHGQFVGLNAYGFIGANGAELTVERYGDQFSAKYTPKQPGPVSVSLQVGQNSTVGQGDARRQAIIVSRALDLIPIEAINAGHAPPALAPAERGRRLFVAKGCASCHHHSAVERSGGGIDLTGRTYGYNWLASLINDPYSVLPPRQSEFGGMPPFNMPYEDVEAIGAFLRQSARKTK
jgi:mono/diheme cytochrome c family protein